VMAIIAWSEKPSASQLHGMLQRYSTIALVSFIVVAVSGLTNAWLRVGTLAELASGYGALVIAKTLSLVILGVMGALYRGRLLGKLEEGTQKNFTVVSRMIAAELTVMGVASGLASALARTQTPIPQIPARDFAQATPAEILTGEPLPPEFTWSKLFTLWELDLLWALIAVFAIVYYVWGHLRLATRGGPLADFSNHSLGVGDVAVDFCNQLGACRLWHLSL